MRHDDFRIATSFFFFLGASLNRALVDFFFSVCILESKIE